LLRIRESEFGDPDWILEQAILQKAEGSAPLPVGPRLPQEIEQEGDKPVYYATFTIFMHEVQQNAADAEWGQLAIQQKLDESIITVVFAYFHPSLHYV
jgi:hypothetical protein